MVMVLWELSSQCIEDLLFLGLFFEVMKNPDVMELNGPRIWIQGPRKHMIYIVSPQG